MRNRSDAEAVQPFDSVLDVMAVGAHVPFARGAGRAGHGIGLAHDADHHVARRKAALVRCLDHHAEQFVAEHQPLAEQRRFAVLARDDLRSVAQTPSAMRAHQKRAVAGAGSSTVSRRAEFGTPGLMVIACTFAPASFTEPARLERRMKGSTAVRGQGSASAGGCAFQPLLVEAGHPLSSA